MSLRAGPPAASGSASGRLYLDRLSHCRLTGEPWPEAGAQSSPAPAVPIPLPHSRSRCLAPSSLSRAVAGTSADTLLLAGITHLPQASPREGPSRAPAPGEGIGSLHAAVLGDSSPWDPRKGTGRVAAGQRDAGHTPWHRELPGERGGRAARNASSQGLNGGQRDAATSPAAHPGAFRTHPCPRTSRRPPAPSPGSRLTGRTR